MSDSPQSAAQAFAAAAAEERSLAGPYKDLRYLVIEDQAASRQTLRMCIQSMGGFSVDIAQSHGEGISRLKNHMPDVILCDYMLSTNRTGQQLLEELRRAEILPDQVVFIMVTAERAYEQVISAVELVPDDYIIKPFAPELLRQRLEKVILKKRAFARYYALKETHQWTGAIEELKVMLGNPALAKYRFDILRNHAEMLVRAERFEEAGAAYESIIDEHPFPWAKAGLARMLQKTERLNEARGMVEEVIRKVPRYFEAYDLKASICGDQGDYAEAQATLAAAAEHTPRNWGRKRSLSVAASRNGDFETARQVMEDVIANDTLKSSSMADYLDLARCAVEAGNGEAAMSLLVSISPSLQAKAGDEERISMECIAAIAEGGEGASRFDRMRSLIMRHPTFKVHTAIDVVRAALEFTDRQLANITAEKILSGPEARQGFKELLGIYRRHELEDAFRDLQKEVASRKLTSKHESV